MNYKRSILNVNRRRNPYRRVSNEAGMRTQNAFHLPIRAALPYNAKRVKGISLIEIIVALGIVILIISLSYAAFVSLNNTKVLEKDTESLAVLIEEAKSDTRSSIEASQYGVYFEIGTNRAILFKGDNYDENDPGNREFILSGKVSISELNLIDGGNAVVFERPKGDTLDYGSIILSLNDGTASSTITIFPTGTIEIL